MPTHDGLTLIIVGCPHAEFDTNRKDIEGHYLRAIELAPALAERLRGAKRVARFAGAAVPNLFRKPYGPGWALVGDAGYNKDPITCRASLTPSATPSAVRTSAGRSSWCLERPRPRAYLSEPRRSVHGTICLVRRLLAPLPAPDAAH